jgi:hypothetical protein
VGQIPGFATQTYTYGYGFRVDHEK